MGCWLKSFLDFMCYIFGGIYIFLDLSPHPHRQRMMAMGRVGPRRHIVFAFRSRYKKPQILLRTHGTSAPSFDVSPLPSEHDRSFLPYIFCGVAPVRPVALTPSSASVRPPPSATASSSAAFWQFKGPPGVTFRSPFLTSKPWEKI